METDFSDADSLVTTFGCHYFGMGHFRRTELSYSFRWGKTHLSRKEAIAYYLLRFSHCSSLINFSHALNLFILGESYDQRF